MKNQILCKHWRHIFISAICLAMASCSSDDLSSVDGGESTPGGGNVGELLDNAITDWGMSRDSVVSAMQGFRQQPGTGNSMLQFINASGSESVSYQMHEGRLCATAIIWPSSSTELDLKTLLNGFTMVGELSGGKVYANTTKNTMATVWQHTETDSTFSAIGLAPIKSDAFESLAPIAATTEECEDAGMCSATLKGRVVGEEESEEVGFQYGMDSNLAESNSRKVSTNVSGSFAIKVNGLVDDTMYYYRAYAVVDDIYYYGDVKSFRTKQLTYSINGKTYKMIRVRGGDMGEFSIMQTELPGDCEILIGDMFSGMIKTREECVTKATFRSFMEELREITGIPFRLPTPEEWTFAAQGGDKGKGFVYCGGNDIDDVAWYENNSNSEPHSLGLKKPNELGLFDMSGNYAEVCNDTDDDVYVDGPTYGGSWKHDAADCKWNSRENGNKTSALITGTNVRHRSAFDGRYIAVRLVYSRQ